MFHMEHNKWYEEWFNTKYYHILYRHRDETEAYAFISKLLNYVHLPKNSVVWDNACGKGRHSYWLSQMGYKVIGTDLSISNINFANSHYKNPNLSFFVHDMRREFYVKYFDLVLNLFTSMGYFEYNYQEEK